MRCHFAGIWNYMETCQAYFVDRRRFAGAQVVDSRHERIVT